MTKLIMNLQMFAEGDPPPNPAPAPAPNPTPAPAAGKTFSEEYVISLREENKQFRLNAKTFEGHVRTLTGIKDGDITAEHVTAYQKANAKTIADALTIANSRLIAAEVKSLDGYNAKLLEKLIDHTKITIDDKGDVVGLKEQLDALALEFPEVKKTPAAAGGGSANPAGGGNALTTLQQAQAAYDEAMKGDNNALKISLKNALFALQNTKT